MPSFRANGSPTITAAGSAPTTNAIPAKHARPLSTAREDTPIMSRSSTPRSYLSTEHPASSSTYSGERGEHEQLEAPQGQQTPHEQCQQCQHSEESHTPWYKKAIEKYGSLELENKGSVARDHLALERTFLSWLRTSLAFASIGIAITQLFRLNATLSPPDLVAQTSSQPPAPILPPHDPYSPLLGAAIPDRSDLRRLRALGKPLGATFIAIAIVVLLVGFHRYFESQYWVVRGKFPASRGSVALVAFVTGALMVASLVVILATAPGSFEG